MKSYQAIVIGTSAGGFEATKKILSRLHGGLQVAVIVVQHLPNRSNDGMVQLLNDISPLPVKEVEDKDPIVPGTVYLCPPNYHLLIEREKCFTLSAEPKVNFSRPSIDVSFESAAEVYRDELIGVVLTGANSDGSAGLRLIKEYGGMVVVQNPAAADYPEMPSAAAAAVEVDAMLTLDEIADFLNEQFAKAGNTHG